MGASTSQKAIAAAKKRPPPPSLTTAESRALFRSPEHQRIREREQRYAAKSPAQKALIDEGRYKRRIEEGKEFYADIGKPSPGQGVVRYKGSPPKGRR